MSSIITTNNIVKVILHKKSNLKKRSKLLVCTGYPECYSIDDYCPHYGIHLGDKKSGCHPCYCYNAIDEDGEKGCYVRCVEIYSDKIDEIVEYEKMIKIKGEIRN